MFDVFTHEFIYGSPHSSLNEPNTIVLTSTIAGKYFGEEDPVGQSIVSVDRAFTVTGVIADVPRNSHFRFDALASRASLPEEMGSWGNFGVMTYLLLPAGIDIPGFEQKLQTMYDRYMAEIFERMKISIVYNLEPVTRIHLHSDNAGEPLIVGLICKEFLLLVFVSMIVAFPVAYYFMKRWLENFVYRIEPGLTVFLIAALATLTLTFLTVIFRAWRAAVANPVDSLRVE